MLLFLLLPLLQLFLNSFNEFNYSLTLKKIRGLDPLKSIVKSVYENIKDVDKALRIQGQHQKNCGELQKGINEGPTASVQTVKVTAVSVSK